MIIVSVNTRNKFCEITLAHKIASVSYSVRVGADKHLNPAIFFSIMKGITVLLKRIVFSRIHSVI